MEETNTLGGEKITKQLLNPENPTKLLLTVVIAAVVLGVISGFIISQKGGLVSPGTSGNTTANVKDPTQDTKTFKDFAEGVIKAKPQPSDPSDYVEGTHTLQRAGAVPVALTSSVVDLSKYEDKKVKVYGETQKALKEGWLMDVGKVEELK